jgi:hypothetical protein
MRNAGAGEIADQREHFRRPALGGRFGFGHGQRGDPASLAAEEPTRVGHHDLDRVLAPLNRPVAATIYDPVVPCNVATQERPRRSMESPLGLAALPTPDKPTRRPAD